MNGHHPDRPLRITHVITGLGRGGAETMLQRLVAALPEAAGFRHGIVSLTDAGRQGWTGPPAGVSDLGLRRGAAGPLALLRLRRSIRAQRPDVLQGWMYHGNVAARLGAPRGVPVLFNIRHSLHALAEEKAGTRAVLRLGALLARGRVAHVIYCSQASRRQHEAIGYPSSRSIHIPNGFDCDRLRPAADGGADGRCALAGNLPQDALLIGHVARYHPLKNHLGLIAGFAAVARDHPRAHLLMVGRDVTPRNEELQRALQRGGLLDRVHLLGERDDVDRLLPACDLLVSASLSEAFPNVLGEAMACGVPCVATDVGDSAAIVGPTGTLVPAGDPAALAAAMAAFLDLPPAARRERSRAARERILASFSLPAIAARYGDLYRSLAFPTRRPDAARRASR